MKMAIFWFVFSCLLLVACIILARTANGMYREQKRLREEFQKLDADFTALQQIELRQSRELRFFRGNMRDNDYCEACIQKNLLSVTGGADSGICGESDCRVEKLPPDARN